MEELKAGVSVFCKRKERDSIWFLHYLEIFLYFSVSVGGDGRGWSGQNDEEKMLRKMKEIYFLNTIQWMSIIENITTLVTWDVSFAWKASWSS